MLLHATCHAYAMELNNPWLQPFKLSFSGFVSHQSYFDTRQVIVDEESLSLVLPKDTLYDANGNDINSRSRYGAASTETMIRATLDGPRLCNVDTQGVVEVDFIGVAFTVNHFRMRKAFLKLSNDNFALSIGQQWHPVFIEDCFPDILSFNSGRPIEPYARDPQIRLVLNYNHWSILFSAASQVEFSDTGPIGDSSIYLRRSMVPNLHSRIQYTSEHFLAGTAIDFVRIIPRVVTNKDIKHIESLNSVSALAYSTIKAGPFEGLFKVTYSQNAYPYNMLGGYAVHTINPINDFRTYTNLQCIGAWTEFRMKKQIEPAVFVGYVKNLGAQSTIIQSTLDNNGILENTIYAFEPSVNDTFRISPRVRLHFENMIVGFELEYTRTSYGTINNKGKSVNTHSVDCVCLLFVLHYDF